MPSPTFERLLLLSEECATTGHFEVAYHALAAAVHMAKDDDDAAALGLALAVSETQAAMIDAIEPSHPISSHVASHRGTQPLHRSLRGTIEAMQMQLRVAKELADTRSGDLPPAN